MILTSAIGGQANLRHALGVALETIAAGTVFGMLLGGRRLRDTVRIPRRCH